MIDGESLTAAARWGASPMTRVDAVSETGSSPWRLAESSGTADYRPLRNCASGESRVNTRQRIHERIFHVRHGKSRNPKVSLRPLWR